MYRFYMVNFSTVNLSSAIEGPGGLFDFNATLPLVAIQFLLLMFALNTVLYNPLLSVIDERKQYILKNLGKASELLSEANSLITRYENELTNVRTEAQLEITKSQKIHREILDVELNVSQKYIDTLLDNILEDLSNRKTMTLNNLDDSVKFLCTEIQTKLSI